MESTWEGRDLPVLDHIVQICEETGRDSVTAEQIASRSAFDEETVQAALRALSSEEPPFFTPQGTWGGRVLRASNVTGHARRAVGAWPTPESVSDRLVAELESAADDEVDETKKSKLKQLAEFIATGGRDLIVDITAKAITGP